MQGEFTQGQHGQLPRAAKMRFYVHFSSKFLNINFQYLKTKIYFYSLKSRILPRKKILLIRVPQPLAFLASQADVGLKLRH